MSRVMEFIVRRTIIILALALLAPAWMTIIGATPQASACDVNNHCYAQAQNANGNTNHGVYGEPYVHCLYQPGGNRANNEIWDTNSSASNWVEAGITSGVDYNGTYRNKNWFWADKRPGYNYAEHDTSVEAGTDTAYPTEIEFAGNDTWNVYGENSFAHFGTSTNNSATIVTGIAGTEYWGGSTSGIRDIGSVYNLERKSSSNTWYSWGSNAQNFDLGTGNYINGHYDGSTAREYWSGPC